MGRPPISRRDFEAQRGRRFGASNPERMDLAFWRAMVHEHEEGRLRGWRDRGPAGLGDTPTSVRRFFGEEGDVSKGPIWNFARMGATRTPHPDGRLICVGGEHEDWYDPDFCIYNDVVVLDLDGSIQIFGYPRDVFPPTDFHTASLCGDRLILIGRLGYSEERRPGATPVFALDLDDYRIEPLPSLGEAPGWIWGHGAELADGVVTIRGGEAWASKGGDPKIRRNFDDFAYELATGLWTRLTHRPWRQYKIREATGRTFMRGPRFLGCCLADDEPWKRGDDEEPGPSPEDSFLYVSPDSLRPTSFRWEMLHDWDEDPFGEGRRREDRLLVEGVPTSIDLSAFAIEIVIEGDMDQALADAIVQDVRENVEEDVGRPCVVEKDD